MAERSYPTWRRFGSELRNRRTLAGISQGKLGKKVNTSTAMISAVERGTRAPKREIAESLDTAFSTGGTFTRLWIDLAAQQDVPEWFIDALHLEREAVEIREYQMTLVPGLLQTPEYARSMMRHGRPWDDAEAIDRLVDSRMARLAKLGTNPLLWFVVDECAIRRLVGDREVMRCQLARLINLLEDGKVRIQVIPQHAPNIRACQVQ
ncbi:Helix-turn-helix protein [Streptomonospora litoralis]|uniref:Helix-turn-helix protein n=1 Tax=Streptomonospora litoralis TaxID=2498135 RepID=A0A4P6Q0B6_9ACTN|nr:helix-turn-helix transcriptional regulator [Streptomonospora litoralis]QBI52239.1 Helix-turn-helix protein [Streptomonospora litoralis]